MNTYDFKTSHSLDFEFEMLSSSDVTQKMKTIMGKPHRTGFYQILIVESSRSVQMVDFREVKLNENQALFVGKGQIVRFDNRPDYIFKLILFTDTFFNRTDFDVALIKRNNLFNPFFPEAVLSLEPKSKSILKLIVDVWSSEKYLYKGEMIRYLLSAFLIESMQISSKENQVIAYDDYSLALKFSELVDENFKSLKKVNDYITLMQVSSKSLSASLFRSTGKTPKQFINERLILESKRLLVYSSLSVKEISFELGFEEPTNFSKFFRNYTNQSPAEFKNQQVS